MKFLYPHWLWGLTLILPLMALLFWDERLRKLRFTRFAAEATWRILAPDLDFNARLRKGIVWLISFGFILVALARPQWGTHEETSKLSGLDVMLVLDISNSMEVEDIIPNRLQKAKHEIRSLVDHLQGDRVGVVAFAASAQVSCPLTTDLSYLLDTVQILDPKLASSQGTDIGLGLETARKSIERGSEDANSPGGEAQPPSQSSQAIVLISDGEDQEDSATEVAKKLRETGVKLYVIGVGSQKGGPIPVRDENGSLVGYKKDRKQKSVMSQFKPDALQALASAAGGRYWSATDNENEVEDLIQDLGGMHRAEFAERRYVVFEDRFQYPLLVAVLLMFLEMVLPTRKGSASASGLALMILLMVGSVMGSPRPAEALESAPLRAYLENEKGIDSLKDGKVDDAKREFGTAQAIAPDLPELEFNQGVVQLNAGDADAAIQSFGEATKKSLGKDPEFASKSLFNLGVAQTKKGDFKSAVKSYLAAIEQSDSTKDRKVEGEARKNLELLNQEQKKQQQQKKQDQQKKDQDQKQQQQQQEQQKKDEKDKADKQDKQKSDQQKDQDKDKDKKDSEKDKGDQDKAGNEKYDDPKNQQFKSQKLTPEDADRVMEELKHREKELQTKLKQKKTNTQDSVNDW
jgi:Ca-activated chloride channel homolog